MVKRNIRKQLKGWGIDPILAGIVVVLLLFGLVMLFSASVAVGLERFGDSGFFIKRQLVALVIGAGAWYVGFRMPYQFWKEWSLVLLIATIVLLIVVLIPGIGAAGQGAQRWINLGVFTFQPTELTKLSLILYLSAWIAERGERALQDIRLGLVPFVSLLAVLAFLILQQPDLGTLLIIVIIGGILFYIGGADIRHVFGLIVTGLVLSGIAIKAAPYRLARLTAFLNPAADPQGAGYHVKQAIIAVGSGGLFGLGLGHSRQKFFYLPEVTGDSIFAVIAEELGFVFSLLLVGLFVAFFMYCMQIAKKTSDPYARLVVIGIAVWISIQAFVNIGAMLGVLPLTGLPLPLISYGGSSLIIVLFAMGILMRIARDAT